MMPGDRRSWAGRKFLYGTGGAALAARHPDNVVTAVLSPAMGIAALALLLRRRWSVPLALAATARSVTVLQRSLPEVPQRTRVSSKLALRGLGWALRQEAGLVLRHWWPVVFGAALASRHVRRIVGSALLVDLVAAELETSGVDVVTAAAGRRLDDLSYGAGLWWGALRMRSLRCLTVRVAWPAPSSAPLRVPVRAAVGLCSGTRRSGTDG